MRGRNGIESERKSKGKGTLPGLDAVLLALELTEAPEEVLEVLADGIGVGEIERLELLLELLPGK